MQEFKVLLKILFIMFSVSGCAIFGGYAFREPQNIQPPKATVGVVFENYYGYLGEKNIRRMSIDEKEEKGYEESIKSTLKMQLTDSKKSDYVVKIKIINKYEPSKVSSGVWFVLSATSAFVIPMFVDGSIGVEAEVSSANGNFKKVYSKSGDYSLWLSIFLVPQAIINFNSLENQRIALRSLMINSVMNDVAKDLK